MKEEDEDFIDDFEDILEEEEPKKPLAINYYNIYNALEDLFPDQALVIMAAIKKIIVVEKETPVFSTMGITKCGILVISQGFWDKYMTNRNKLQTVLGHELYHHVSADVFHLGDEANKTEDWELRKHADHLAMDARINAFLCGNRPDIKPQDFLKEFYTDEVCETEFLNKILRPDVKFTTKEEKPLEPFHKKLYGTLELCSHHDLSDAIFEILKKRPGGKKLVLKLVGSHGQGGKALTEEDLKGVTSIEIDMSDVTPEELEELKKQAKKRLQDRQDQDSDGKDKEKDSKEEKNDPSVTIRRAVIDKLSKESAMGIGKASEISTVFLNEAVGITEKFDLAKFKHLAFNRIFWNVRSQARQKVGKYSTSPIMPKKIATSDLILKCCGIPILLWKTRRTTYQMDKNLLPIYLDVSGSTWDFLPEIIKLIVNIGQNELDFVWGFSNKVAKHTFDDLKNNKIDSTGGTDFDCIIAHATENEFEHIVVMTDGDAYCKATERLPNLKSVVTILFGYSNRNNFFSNVYENTHLMDEVKL